jgi:uncharacterized membrane protein
VQPTAAAHPGDFPKGRIEALGDGVYAIALTLLVLDLKLPPLGEAVSNAQLLDAIRALLPKALTWVLSFWVMAILWISQVRIYRLVHSLTRNMLRLELLQLAFVSLLPFSTSVIGEYGNLPAAAVLYTANMVAMTLTGALRTRELLHSPHVHAEPIDEKVHGRLKLRALGLPACAIAAFVLAFFVPGWNMLAMLPMVFMPGVRRG